MSNKFQLLIRLWICCVLAGVIALSWGRIGHASSGWINENYSFESLELKGGTVVSPQYGRVYSCIFRGKIISTANSERENVTITFYAINVFDEVLWESSVHINSLPPFESYEFSNKISCQEKEPYKWRFKVVEEPENMKQ